MSDSACTLVAIARDEARHLPEWLAYNLAVGFERILVFDNGSQDGTGELLARIAAREPRVATLPWPSRPFTSPQCSAYQHALSLVDTPWVAFFDVDEFVVPWRDGSIPAYLATLPDDVSAVHVNWRSFGSSGRETPDYDLVVETFTGCAEPHWFNQAHYKTIARTARVGETFVHHVEVTSGRRVLTDGEDLRSDNPGIADRIAYGGIQVNHYQTKTWPEFERRMRAGDAFFSDDHPSKSRERDARVRFEILDRNEDADPRVLAFLPGLRERLAAFREAAAGS